MTCRDAIVAGRPADTAMTPDPRPGSSRRSTCCVQILLAHAVRAHRVGARAGGECRWVCAGERLRGHYCAAVARGHRRSRVRAVGARARSGVCRCERQRHGRGTHGAERRGGDGGWGGQRRGCWRRQPGHCRRRECGPRWRVRCQLCTRHDGARVGCGVGDLHCVFGECDGRCWAVCASVCVCLRCLDLRRRADRCLACLL